IMRQIRRKGPSHGAIGRAIAETRYVLDYHYDIQAGQGRCHVVKPAVKLMITFVFPRLAGEQTPELRQSFDSFVVGARSHEQGHAQIAIEMAHAAKRALSQASYPLGRSGCKGLDDAVDREMQRIFTSY